MLSVVTGYGSRREKGGGGRNTSPPTVAHTLPTVTVTTAIALGNDACNLL